MNSEDKLLFEASERPGREKDNGFEEIQDGRDRDSNQAKRNQKNPDNGVKDKG